MIFTAGARKGRPPFLGLTAFDCETRGLSGWLSHFNSMSKLAIKLKEEFFAILPPTIFFFVALHIVALVHRLMMKAAGISPLCSVSIVIAALIMGKAVLLAD